MRPDKRHRAVPGGPEAAARLLLSLLFILSGIAKIATPAGTRSLITSAGLPFPHVVYWGAIAVELGGGVLLLLGLATRPVAAVMTLFTVSAAALFHRDIGNPQETISLLKDLAIAGGLLHVAVCGAGRWSLDALRRGEDRE